MLGALVEKLQLDEILGGLDGQKEELVFVHWVVKSVQSVFENTIERGVQIDNLIVLQKVSNVLFLNNGDCDPDDHASGQISVESGVGLYVIDDSVELLLDVDFHGIPFVGVLIKARVILAKGKT